MLDAAATNTSIAVHAKDLGVAYRRYLTKVTTLKSAVLSMFRGSKYESFWALRGIGLELRRGDRLGVIGVNGSGKSTLLKAIAGVLPPTEGSIAVRGRVAPLLELGGGFRVDLTGRENIYLNGAIMGLNRKAVGEKLESIVDFADIGDFIDAPLNTYSSGMRARLGFAVATDIEPEILLLDEILSVGDIGFREKAMARMDEFFESGTTMVMASHNMEIVRRVCDRVLYLHKGRIVASGEPEVVIQQYVADAQKPAARN